MPRGTAFFHTTGEKSGLERIAVVARRGGVMVTNKQVYRVLQRYGLLQKKRVREAALYQAARLFELLPQAQNELWQADVTYLHLPGHSWWYAVTVIDTQRALGFTVHCSRVFGPIAAVGRNALITSSWVSM